VCRIDGQLIHRHNGIICVSCGEYLL